MRRAVVWVGAGVLAAALLAGCGSSAVSYNDGFAVGQSLASAAAAPLSGRAALATCRRQSTVARPATDSRSQWIKGCVAGVAALQATVGLPDGAPRLEFA